MTWLRVQGMVCGHCTGRAHKALEAAAGLDSVWSSPMNRRLLASTALPVRICLCRLSVMLDSRRPIDNLHPSNSLLAVEGMMCDHCRGKFQRALEAVFGVEAVHVD
eukprot:3510719-Pleurochrysis_carterae.AAC.1